MMNDICGKANCSLYWFKWFALYSNWVLWWSRKARWLLSFFSPLKWILNNTLRTKIRCEMSRISGLSFCCLPKNLGFPETSGDSPEAFKKQTRIPWRIINISWVVPFPTNSHHQDCYIFSNYIGYPWTLNLTIFLWRGTTQHIWAYFLFACPPKQNIRVFFHRELQRFKTVSRESSNHRQNVSRYARLLWEFWKRDSELFPPEAGGCFRFRCRWRCGDDGNVETTGLKTAFFLGGGRWKRRCCPDKHVWCFFCWSSVWIFVDGFIAA